MMADHLTELDLFSFAEESAAAPEDTRGSGVRKLTLREMQQLAFGFLCSLRPDAAAQQVPTRQCRLPVSAAGFWRVKSGRRRQVERTVLVALCPDFNGCFAECSGQHDRLERVMQMRELAAEMEAEIRKNEPHLAAPDDLFDDFRTWDYSGSCNQEYHQLKAELEREMRILSTGGKLERLVRGGVADLCYLAAPAEVAAAASILPGWGLVELSPGEGFKVLREAEPQLNVTPEGRQFFALNIAQASAAAVRFASGIDCGGSGGVSFRRLPRKRGRLKL